ncbi:MAG TPA: tetratricopeptide repeat protein [Chitinophagaceae bacterium]|nr:tetratricopeptide repeat protein [Chitinophagaceae bacterium]
MKIYKRAGLQNITGKRIFHTILFLFATTSSPSQPCSPIVSPSFSEAVQKEYHQNLQLAKAEYEKDTANADALTWYGRRLAYTGDYMGAIAVFTSGIKLHPDDARLYRHRGHRYITVRCFDLAIDDFIKAAELTEGEPDETEPDGLPNAKNIPTSTLQSNIWYHLGLAFFLKKEYKKAEKAYRQGLEVSKNDDMYVAMANWLHITLLAQGREREAGQLYSTVPAFPDLIENEDYLRLLQIYYKEKPASPVAVDLYIQSLPGNKAALSSATLYFGIGFYCHLKGMKEKAGEMFQKAIATGQWASFGYIAAEKMLGERSGFEF